VPAGALAAAVHTVVPNLSGVRLAPAALSLAAPGRSATSVTFVPVSGLGLLPGVVPVMAAPAVPKAAPIPTAARAEAPVALGSLQGLAAQAEAKEAGQAGEALDGFFDRSAARADGADIGSEAAEDFGSRFRVPFAPEGSVELAAMDPDMTPGLKRHKDGKIKGKQKDKAADQLSEDQKALDGLQQRLYAEGQRSVLIVLQAMDTGGKDGTIRWVLGPLNPQGFKVTGFKKPSAQEAQQPYLWRIRNALPGRGIIGVFNRSHYEDILVPTVYKTLPESEVAGRYEEINAFEKELADQGVLILKFFLNISKAEQKRRLQERLDTPEKLWKFSAADLESRKKWEEFQAAYGGVLARTSTPWAPWHVIPANKKWFRNYAIGRIIRQALEKMDPQYPKPTVDPKTIIIPD
jgi:PPK2 family polyphosphate:nucleotide phosphotransferase